jgi:hypothetical protein
MLRDGRLDAEDAGANGGVDCGCGAVPASKLGARQPQGDEQATHG